MKAAVILLWYRSFNRRNLVRIDFDDLVSGPYECGDLIVWGGTVSGINEYMRYIKDGWVVRTDGKYPMRLVIRDKIRGFFRFNKAIGWYIKFLLWIFKIFPSLGNMPANTRISRLMLWPKRFQK